MEVCRSFMELCDIPPSWSYVMTHSYVLCVSAYARVYVSECLCEQGEVLMEMGDKACLAHSSHDRRQICVV